MLNVLYLQSEVAELEKKYNAAVLVEDRHQNGYSCDWTALRKAGKKSPQWDAFQQLRERLIEYDQAVALQITMENQVGPKAEHYSQLRAWIRDSEGLANSISGPGSQTWSPAHLGGHESSDLMAIGTRYIGDPMSRWIGGHVANVLKKLPAKFTHPYPFLPEEGKNDYLRFGTFESINTIGDRVGSFLAAVLLLVPVVVLHFIDNATGRLAVIVCFSVAFILALTLGTDATRSEIFAASAAFVAVQVVYVGSALNQH